MFAVGDNGTILHYDGSVWSKMTSNTSKYLEDVWANSTNDVFAVGWDGTILHYNGSSWSEMVSGTRNTLYGVWGSSSNNVFAVGGGGLVLHYDGVSWSQEPINVGILNAVWGSSEKDVFCVGGVDNNHIAILHYGEGLVNSKGVSMPWIPLLLLED